MNAKGLTFSKAAHKQYMSNNVFGCYYILRSWPGWELSFVRPGEKGTVLGEFKTLAECKRRAEYDVVVRGLDQPRG